MSARRDARLAGCLLMALGLAGCSSGPSQKGSMEGKTYTPAGKSQKSTGGSGSAADQSVMKRPPETPAGNTTKDEVVLNPGAPTANQPPPNPKPQH